jgi:hypothetical protein
MVRIKPRLEERLIADVSADILRRTAVAIIVDSRSFRAGFSTTEPGNQASLES